MSPFDEHDPTTRSRSHINRTARPAFYVVLALIALAPILGGSTKLWAAASLAAATGLLFLIAPPTRSLGRVPNIAFVALIALALVAFLPNRNHTSNVLGIGGIVVYALALDGFARRQRHWWIWIVALSLICWALILDYSRAGIILVVAGMVAWHLFWLITSDNKRRPLIASA